MLYSCIFADVTDVIESDLPSAKDLATALLLGAGERFGVEDWAGELRAVKATDGSSRWRKGEALTDVPAQWIEQFGALGAVALIAAGPELLAARR